MEYKKLAAAVLAAGLVLALNSDVQAAKHKKDTNKKQIKQEVTVAKKGGVNIVTNGSKVATEPAGKPVNKVVPVAKKQVPAPLLTVQNGKVFFAGTELPPDYKTISIYGAPEATKAQAVALIKANNPQVRLACTVEELVDWYWEEAGRENVRPDLALAQSLVETGTYSYGGDVQHHQNNFCGLGTTGGGVRGASFATPQLGVRAHVQHLLAYTQKQRPSTEIIDPRYEIAHKIRVERGVVDTWSGLNGTWAMGSLYCEKIMAQYQKMLAQEGAAEKKEEKPVRTQKRRSMRDRIDELLHEQK